MRNISGADPEHNLPIDYHDDDDDVMYDMIRCEMKYFRC